MIQESSEMLAREVTLDGKGTGNSFIDIVFRSDGRVSALEQCWFSFMRMVRYPAGTRLVLVEDRPDDTLTRDWIAREAGSFHRIIIHPTNQGAAASMNSAMEAVRPGATLFMLEADFVFREPVDLDVLEQARKRLNLLGLALKRQPINELELRAGDLLRHGGAEANIERQFGAMPITTRKVSAAGWNFYTCNPSLWSPEILRLARIPPETCYLGESWYESNVIRAASFGFAEREFGFVGAPGDQPMVTHIGIRRR